MYALIKNSVVQDVVAVDANASEAFLGSYDQVVACSASVQIGDLYAPATGFSKPDASHYVSIADPSVLVTTNPDIVNAPPFIQVQTGVTVDEIPVEVASANEVAVETASNPSK